MYQLNKGGRRIIPLLRATVFDSFQGILDRPFAATIRCGGALGEIQLVSVVKESLDGPMKRDLTCKSSVLYF
jgi:hypothetical protein